MGQHPHPSENVVGDRESGALLLPGASAEDAPILYGERIIEDPALLEEHIELRCHCRPSMRGHYAQLRAASTWTSRPWLRDLQMPVLVISGSDDRLVPVANGRMIASAVANGRLEVIDHGSHVCVIQETSRTSRVISEFLAED